LAGTRLVPRLERTVNLFSSVLSVLPKLFLKAYKIEKNKSTFVSVKWLTMDMTEEQYQEIVRSIYNQVFTDRTYVEDDYTYDYEEGDYVFPFSNLSDSQMEWFFYEDYEPITTSKMGYLYRGEWFPGEDDDLY